MWILLFLLFFLFPSPVFAQTDAISVSPSLLRLDLQTDEPTALLTYKNTTNQTIELTLRASDFTELEDGYKPSFLEEKNAANYQYRLSEWITFDKKTLVLSPNETEQIKIFVNQDKLTPGGHYAAILAQVTNHTDKGDVSIQAVLSSLLFVRTNTGREIEEGSVDRFAPSRELLAFPKQFLLRFHNKGDTEVIPYGLVEVTDMFGHVVSKGILNEGSLISLPESIRRYDILVKINTFLFPGRYTATFTGHFGKTEKKITTQTVFFSEGNVPLVPLMIFGATLCCLFIWRRKKKHK